MFPSFHCLQNNLQDYKELEHGNLLQEEIQLFDWKILQKDIQGAPAKKYLFYLIIHFNKRQFLSHSNAMAIIILNSM